ncbi:DUF3054 domain-containing protein [Nocardia sp. NPDC049220]|uniref:DUF3054 domain-containing protein n=1 Tax=Nocardia sp. NPDC049220 TaxID=3155273 RepID=UPI0033C7C32A
MRKLVPLIADALLVILFCAIGRRSHDEAIFAGLLRTLWPFAIGLALGWAVAAVSVGRIFGEIGRGARFDGTSPWPSGIVIWLCTLVGGMVLRVVSGQGTAFSFVLVASTVLALFLVGWRAAFRALT